MSWIPLNLSTQNPSQVQADQGSLNRRLLPAAFAMGRASKGSHSQHKVRKSRYSLFCGVFHTCKKDSYTTWCKPTGCYGA